KAGWRRSFEVVKKDGTSQLRPGGLSRLFGLLIMLGPALPLALTPLGHFPITFFACALPLYAATRIAESFFRRTLPESTVTVNTVTVAAVSVVLLLLIGVVNKVLL